MSSTNNYDRNEDGTPSSSRGAAPANHNDDDVIMEGSSERKTPYDLYFERMKAFQEEHNLPGLMLVKGVNRNEEDEDFEEEEDEEEDNSNLTTEQMETLRFILLTDNRMHLLEEYRQLILGDQADGGIMMFNTSFSYEVLGSWDVCKRHLARKSSSNKLDILIAYTHNIMEWDCWIHDNEGDMGPLVKGLATVWRNLLKKNDDAALGWDLEYTKPGVMEMLSQFKEKIDNMDSCFELGKFKYM